MRIYETIYICPPNLSDDAAEEFCDLVREIIYENGGKIIKQERWGKKRLAYEINHHKEGIYYYFLYGGEKVNIQELERRLRIADECIRFLTVRLDKELKGKKHKIFTKEELALALQMDGRKPAAPKEETEAAPVAEEAAPAEEKPAEEVTEEVVAPEAAAEAEEAKPAEEGE